MEYRLHKILNTIEFLQVISYFPTMLCKFENSEYPIPVNYDYILKQVYGDYMTLPSPDKRITHSPIAIKLKND